jgi:L-ascorbate metabolism protein UlaG (beta-lactamase superfamily)
MADAILVSHGHGDHIDDLIACAPGDRGAGGGDV